MEKQYHDCSWIMHVLICLIMLFLFTARNVLHTTEESPLTIGRRLGRNYVGLSFNMHCSGNTLPCVHWLIPLFSNSQGVLLNTHGLFFEGKKFFNSKYKKILASFSNRKLWFLLILRVYTQSVGLGILAQGMVLQSMSTVVISLWKTSKKHRMLFDMFLFDCQ